MESPKANKPLLIFAALVFASVVTGTIITQRDFAAAKSEQAGTTPIPVLPTSTASPIPSPTAQVMPTDLPAPTQNDVVTPPQKPSINIRGGGEDD